MWTMNIEMSDGIFYYQIDPINRYCKRVLDMINKRFDLWLDLNDRQHLLNQLNSGSDLPMWRVLNVIHCNDRLVTIHFYHDGYLHHISSCNIIYGVSQCIDVTLNDIKF